MKSWLVLLCSLVLLFGCPSAPQNDGNGNDGGNGGNNPPIGIPPSFNFETYCSQAEVYGVYECPNYDVKVAYSTPGKGSEFFKIEGEGYAKYADCPPVSPDEMSAECKTLLAENYCSPTDRCGKNAFNLEELCADDNVGSIHSCIDGTYKVVLRLLGAGAKYYASSGSFTQCPVVGPDSVSEGCNALGALSCSEQNLCAECSSDNDCQLSLCDCSCYPAGKTPEALEGTLCGINCLGEQRVAGCNCAKGKCSKRMAGQGGGFNILDLCSEAGVEGIYTCEDGGYKVVYSAQGAGFTVYTPDGSELRCNVDDPTYTNPACYPYIPKCRAQNECLSITTAPAQNPQDEESLDSFDSIQLASKFHDEPAPSVSSTPSGCGCGS